MTATNKDKLCGYLLAIYIMGAIIISYLPWGANISQGIGIILAITFMFQLIVQNNKLKMTQELFLFLFFFVYSLIGFLLARNLVGFSLKERTLFQLVILSIVSYNILSSKFSIALAIKAFVFGALISSVVYLVGNKLTPYTRITGTLENANLYGLTLLFAITLSLYLIKTNTNKWHKLFYYLLISFFSYLIIFTGSRKAIIGFASLPILLYITYFIKIGKRHLFRILCLTILLLGFLIGFSIYLTQTPFYYRIQSFQELIISSDINTVEDGSLINRFYFYKMAYHLWKQHPILGVGNDQFRYYTGVYFPLLRSTYSHSNYMEILADFGIVGFILYYLIYLAIFRNLFRLWRLDLIKNDSSVLILLTVLMIQLTISELAWVTYLEKLTWVLLTIVIATTHNLMKKYNEKSINVL